MLILFLNIYIFIHLQKYNKDILCYISYITQKMNWFEYIITLYNSFVDMITEVQLDTNDILNDYGGI